MEEFQNIDNNELQISDNRYEIMENISNGLYGTIDVDKVRSQLGAFQLAQAQNALLTVVKLTKTLDKLQSKYDEKLTQYIEENDDETAIEYLPTMIDTISKCLDRASNIVSTVMGNKDVQNMMIIDASDKSINIANNTAEVRTAIGDPVSREKIRNAVSKVLDSISKEQNDNNA